MKLAFYAIGYVLVGAAFAFFWLLRHRDQKPRGEIILFLIFWPVCALLSPMLAGGSLDRPRAPGLVCSVEPRNEADGDDGSSA